MLRRMLLERCRNCGTYFVGGEMGVGEARCRQLERRGLRALDLGDIRGSDLTCLCGESVYGEVEVSEDECFVCGRALGKSFMWHEHRWNEAGDHLAWICQTCLKKENKQVKADKKQGVNGKRHYPK